MNEWSGTGVLITNPDTRPTRNGVTITKFRLAVPRDRDRPPLWLNMVAFHGLARTIELRFGRGDWVHVRGQLDQAMRTAPDGSRRREFFVVAEDLELVTSPDDQRCLTP